MKYYILLFVLGIYSISQAQNTISGTVNDETGNPIMGAEIYIEQLHIGTTTDENGFYILKNIPRGKHKLTFSFVGYTSVNEEIVSSEQNLVINRVMTTSIFHMDEVILSAPFHRLQSENVMKIESKSISSLRKNGGVTLIEGLTSIPGVEQLSTGTGIGKPVIRGLSGNRVLVYTQGVRLENQQFGDEHGLGLNDAGIESVEVIKGPASLLYGSDALGGVLYFNPEKFAFQNETNATISQNFFSNTLGSNTSVGVKTSKEIFKFLLRGTYNTHSDYQIPNGDRVTNTRFNEKDLKAGFGLNFDKFVTELRYNFNDAKIGITEGIENQSTNKSPDLPYQSIQNHILSLHNHFFFNEAKIDINLGYVFNHRQEFEDEHGHEHGNEEEMHEEDEIILEEEHEEKIAALDMELATFTYEAKYYFPKSKKFETIVGVQGLSQNNKNFGEEILIPNAKINDLGFLGTSIYNIDENNILQGGLRFDHRNLKTEPYTVESHDHEEVGHDEEVHMEEEIEVSAIDRNYSNFTFSLGYRTKLFDKIIARINFASGFRAPNLAELTSFGVHHGTNRFEIGNPNLKSEQNFQSDISIEYGNEHIEIFANGFYNLINNYIFASPTGMIEEDYAVFEYVQNDADLYGGEMGVHFHPHPLDWLHLESSYEMVIGKQDGGEYLPLIPANKWSNTIRGEFKGNQTFHEIYLAFNLDSYFEQDRVSGFEERTPGYNLFNVRMGSQIDFRKLSVQANLSLNNLLDKEYISHMSALKTSGILNPGRNFILGLSFNIL